MLRTGYGLLIASTMISTGAQGQSIDRIWAKPNSCIRGKVIEFAILGTGFDPGTAKAQYFGASPCQNGCALKLDESFPELLTGRVKIDSDGEYSIAIQNGDNVPTPQKPLCVVTSPKISQILTRPDPPIAGMKLELTLVGSGFDPDSAAVSLGSEPLMWKSRNYNVISSETIAPRPGIYNLSISNIGDPAGAVQSLEIPLPQVTAFVANPNAPTRGVPFSFLISGENFATNLTTVLVYRQPDCRVGCIPDFIQITKSTATFLSGRMTVRSPGQFAIGVRSAGSLSSPYPEFLTIH